MSAIGKGQQITGARALGVSAVWAACAFVAALALVPAGAMAAPETPKVVVTLKPIHALVSSVMEGAGTPLLIADGSASPHTFTLKPSGAQAISQADVFFRVSEALEPFTRKVAAALPPTVTLVSLVDAPGVTLLDQRRGDTFEAHGHDDRADGHGHDGDPDTHDSATKDSHIWLDPANAKAIVAQIARVLADKYPDAAQTFSKNAAALTAKLDQLSVSIASELAPVKDKPFVVFHDAIQYFEARFGLAAAGSVTVSPDVQPSAKRLTAVRKKVAILGPVCVFSEPGFQPKLIAAITEGSSARAGTLDAEGISLTPGPDLYFELMRNLARDIKSCLGPA